MKKLRQKTDRFLYNNSNKGIPHLMLFICIATLISYFIQLADSSGQFYNFIRFDRYLILHGQLWRLFTYILVPQSNGIWLFLFLFAYYGIGRMIENIWGTLKFNLFYLIGVLIMDIACLIFNRVASTTYLNLSLFLALATIRPDSKVMLMYIIPLKMKYLAWAYMLLLLAQVIMGDFLPIFALVNYFLFFGWDFINVLPEFMQNMFHHSREKSYSYSNAKTSRTRPNRNWAKSYKNPNTGKSSREQSHAKNNPEYRHKCTVCGRTDVSNPELEFRYCSRCSGFYCYCEDHINNHPHIKE